MRVIVPRQTLFFLKITKIFLMPPFIKPSAEQKPIEWIIHDSHHGYEVISFISCMLENLSKKAIKRLIDEGCLFINGTKVLRSNYLVSRKDQVRLYFQESGKKQASLSSARILYEDASFLAISKPWGIPTTEKDIRGIIESIKGSLYPTPLLVHRLDMDTSGVLLVAKNTSSQQSLETLFRERKIKKTYLALVVGEMAKPKGSIRTPLIVEKSKDRKEAIVRVAHSSEAHDAHQSHTDWEVICTSQKATLVKVYPHTGRTHQIRVHFSSIGHPLVGEKKYISQEKERFSYSCARHMLHALKIEALHPDTKKQFIVYDKVPGDFCSLIHELFGPDGDKIICELS